MILGISCSEKLKFIGFSRAYSYLFASQESSLTFVGESTWVEISADVPRGENRQWHRLKTSEEGADGKPAVKEECLHAAIVSGHDVVAFQQ